jgi:hypothetical protein
MAKRKRKRKRKGKARKKIMLSIRKRICGMGVLEEGKNLRKPSHTE